MNKYIICLKDSYKYNSEKYNKNEIYKIESVSVFHICVSINGDNSYIERSLLYSHFKILTDKEVRQFKLKLLYINGSQNKILL